MFNADIFECSEYLYFLAHGHCRRPLALVTFNCNNLVVEGASHCQSSFRPCIEVVLRSHSSRSALVLPDRPELSESLSSIDGRSILPSGGIDVVRRAIAVDSAKMGSSRAWIILAEGFGDVVLVQRVFGPAVDGKISVLTGGVVVGREGDVPTNNLISKWDGEGKKDNGSTWHCLSTILSQQRSCCFLQSRSRCIRLHRRWCKSHRSRRPKRNRSSRLRFLSR